MEGRYNLRPTRARLAPLTLPLLPTELLGSICGFLKPRDGARLAASCRWLWGLRAELLRCTHVRDLPSDVIWPTVGSTQLAIGTANAVVRAAIRSGVSLSRASNWAATGGFVDVLVWLYARMTPSEVHSQAQSDFEAACQCGRLDLVKHLLSTPALVTPETRLLGLKHGCTFKRLPLIEHLVAEVLSTIELASVNDDDPLFLPTWAAKGGHLALIKLLVERHSFASEPAAGTVEALVAACTNDHHQVVEYLLEQGKMSPSDVCAENHLVLRWAACTGNLACVKLLVARHGLDGPHVLGALSIAFAHDNVSIAAYLLFHAGLTSEDVVSDNSLAMRWAAENGHLAIVQQLVSTYTDVMRGPQLGLGLEAACRNNKEQVAMWLLYKTALPTSVLQTHFECILRWACKNGHLGVVELLVQKCTSSAPDRYLHFGLHLACTSNHPAIVHYLLVNVDFSIDDVRACNGLVLRRAAELGCLMILEVLVGKYRIRGCDLRPGLVAACQSGQLASVKYLLCEAGMNSFDACACDNQALSEATRAGHRDVVEYLIAKLRLRGLDLRIALVAACEAGQMAVIEALMAAGMSANDVRASDNLALRQAATYGQLEVVKVLMSVAGLGGPELSAALASACAAKQTEVAKHFLNAGNMSVEDISAEDNLALREAAQQDCMPLLVVLVDAYKDRDAEIDASVGLLAACEAGALDAVTFFLALLSANSSSTTSARESREHAQCLAGLAAAVRQGRDRVVGFLVRYCDLRGADLCAAFVAACEFNRLELADYLVKKGQMSLEDICADECRALQIAASNGHEKLVMSVMDWVDKLLSQMGRQVRSRATTGATPPSNSTASSMSAEDFSALKTRWQRGVCAVFVSACKFASGSSRNSSIYRLASRLFALGSSHHITYSLLSLYGGYRHMRGFLTRAALRRLDGEHSVIRWAVENHSAYIDMHRSIISVLIFEVGLRGPELTPGLQAACLRNNKGLVEYLLTCKVLSAADVRAHDSVALRWAAEHGHMEFVKLLTSRKHFKDFRVNGGHTYKMYGGEIDDDHFMSEHDIEFWDLDSFGAGSLSGIGSDYWDDYDMHLKCNVTKVSVSGFGLSGADLRPGLVAACQASKEAVLWHLLTECEMSADDVRVSDNMVLRWAAEHRHSCIVEHLVEEYGLCGSELVPALKLAATCSRQPDRDVDVGDPGANFALEVVEFLLDNGGMSADDVRVHSSIVLQWAGQGGHCSVVERLVKNFKLSGSELRPAFVAAIASDHGAIVEYLLKEGGLSASDVRVHDNLALEWAVERNCMHVIELLVKGASESAGRRQAWLRGPDLSAGLVAACLSTTSHDEAVRYLLQHGAMSTDDVRVRNNLVLRWAAENGHLWAVQMLVEKFGLCGSELQAALRAACTHAQPQTSVFFSTASASRDPQDPTLQPGYDAFAIVMFLLSRGGMDADDVRVCNNMVLRWAEENCFDEITDYLESEFGVSEAELSDEL